MKKNKTELIILFVSLVVALAAFAEILVGFVNVPVDIREGVKDFTVGIGFISAFIAVVELLFFRFEARNDFDSILRDGLLLSKDGRIPDSELLVIESDLDHYFNCKDGTYHIIVISSCVDTNEYAFMKAIWDNISKGNRYLYITPFSDQDFINQMITLFSEKKFADLTTVYKLVVNRISHISDPTLFDVLPKEFDLCIYMKDNANHRVSNTNWGGFISTLWLKNSEDKTIAYYYPITEELFGKIYKKYSRMFSSERIIQSYISPKIEYKNSPIHGIGAFCRTGESLQKGEVAFIKGGYELHRKDMSSQKIIDSYLPIGDDLFLAAKTAEEEELVKIYVNHSCKPNLGIKGDRTFIAMRNISEAEELTIDYAFVDNEDYEFICKCRTPKCRHKITGFDWKKENIQKRYKKYFSEYLQKKF